ncbi:hypothetical protein OG885_41890 [Streptomyces sp. NBC_00028]
MSSAFGTDNALLSRLPRNLERAERNNLVKKPTDATSLCEQRAPGRHPPS